MQVKVFANKLQIYCMYYNDDANVRDYLSKRMEFLVFTLLLIRHKSTRGIVPNMYDVDTKFISLLLFFFLLFYFLYVNLYIPAIISDLRGYIITVYNAILHLAAQTQTVLLFYVTRNTRESFPKIIILELVGLRGNV